MGWNDGFGDTILGIMEASVKTMCGYDYRSRSNPHHLQQICTVIPHLACAAENRPELRPGRVCAYRR